MIIFGMNTEKEYRWLMIAFVFSYYFYEVRDIYISHYEHQRRLLTQGAPPDPTQPGATLLQSAQSLG